MCTRITRPLKSTGFASPRPEPARNRLPSLVKARDQPDLPPSADEPTISNIRSAQDKTDQPLIMQETMPQVQRGPGGGGVAELRICRCLSMPDDMLPLRMCGFCVLSHAEAQSADAPARDSAYPRPKRLPCGCLYPTSFVLSIRRFALPLGTAQMSTPRPRPLQRAHLLP